MHTHSQPRRVPRIDAHHHLWRYNPVEFAWLDDRMSTLRRDFLVKDFEDVLDASGVDAAVAVQARQSLDETAWLLECAETTDAICAVVGWVEMDSPTLAIELDRFACYPKLVGYREIVQGRVAGYLDREEFHRGMEQLTARDLSYDLLIYENQLEEAIRLVDRHPLQRFILDHAAKPRIAARELACWTLGIRELAQRQNVSCKLSGLVTEADWQKWSLDVLRPYLDVCVEAFGPMRLLAGSDWPVCLVATSYQRWWSVLEQYFGEFNVEDIDAIFGGNAIAHYRIPTHSQEAAL